MKRRETNITLMVPFKVIFRLFFSSDTLILQEASSSLPSCFVRRRLCCSCSEDDSVVEFSSSRSIGDDDVSEAGDLFFTLLFVGDIILHEVFLLLLFPDKKLLP